MARKPKQTQDNKIESAEMNSNHQSLEILSAEAQAGATHYGAEYRSRCGGALRASREKIGLSIQEIANQLRLSTKQIEALEADNFTSLPEATIVKGFIRNYAKILKISAEPLLDAYNVFVPDKAPQSFTLHPSVNMKISEYEKPSATRYVFIGLIFLFGFCVWLFYQNYVQKPNPIKPVAELASEAEEVVPEIALPTPETVTAQTAVNAAPEAINTSQAKQVDSITTPEALEKNTASIANQAVPIQKELSEATLSQIPSNGKSKLEFNATQETWISVVDANGREVYSRILFAGNREIIEAKAPLNITVGNALGTTLNVNGKSVDLAPHTRTNVAHIKVD